MAGGGLPRGLAWAIALVLSLAAAGVRAEERDIVLPYEREGGPASLSRIDSLVGDALRQRDIRPAYQCSDEVFARRVYLDVTGTLPTPQAVRAFLANTQPEKRADLIEALMQTEEFADYWALKWCDILRVKAEFPINLWPNSVQAYHRWVRDAMRKNMAYDEFVRALLTSSGSNFRVPPVNFYRAVQGREPASIAGAVALTFMGTRIETWPEEQRLNMAAFFSRVGYKKTAEWKEEIVQLAPAPAEAMSGVLPDGRAVRIEPGKDPRVVFTDWLLEPGNPWLARNAVNRAWYWLMGRGIIHEPDDIRPDNPATNPELLAYLEKEFAQSDYDMRHVFRLILNSGVYQQSSIPRSDHPEAEALFAHYPVRRLDAEVLVDALCWITGSSEGYSSPIPEPFTYIPPSQRTIALADGSITSQFLEMFGRPARDTGLESERNNQPTDAQRLHMLNSSHIQRKIENSSRLKDLLRTSNGKPAQAIRSIYVTVLSRYPTKAELGTALEYAASGGVTPPQAAADLVWALINTKEFLYRH